MADDDDQLASSMTHYADAFNPAKSTADAVTSYLKQYGLDLQPVHEAGTQPADYLNELARNPDIMQRDISQAGNFAFGAGALKLQKASSIGPYDHRFDVLNDAGNKVAHLGIQWKPWRNEVYVSGMQSDLPANVAPGSAAARSNTNAHSLGAGEIRTLVDEIRRHFPQAVAITALRTSGARVGPASAAAGEDWPLARLDLNR